MNIKENNQTGAASLLFTLIMIIVISLIAIGFSVITTSDQKETLNKNLASNADYAAQSAINSIVEAVVAKNPNVTATQPTCLPPSNALVPQFPNTNSKISCLKWNYNPQNLTYSATNAANTVINPQNANSTGAAVMSELDITWTTTTSSPLYATSSPVDLSGAVSFNNFPILRIVTSNRVLGNFMTTYVYPTQGTPGVVSITQSVNIIAANCGSAAKSNTCTVKLKDFNGVDASGNSIGWKGDITHCSVAADCGLVSVSTLDGSNVGIQIGGSTSSGNAIALADSQIQIDATATNGNTVKRIIAGYSINGGTGWLPSFTAASSNALCKNYQYNFPSSPGTGASAGPAAPATLCF